MALLSNIPFLILIIAFIAIPQKSSEKKSEFNLKEKLVIGNSGDVWFLDAKAVVQSGDGMIFVADKLSYSVEKLDSKGKKIGGVGRRGGGPGEFRGPFALDIFKNLMAVADFSSPRIQIFDTSLKYLRTFYVKGVVFDIAFDKDGYLWVGIMQGKKDVLLHQYTIEGKLLKSIKPKNSTDNEYEFAGIFWFTITDSRKIVIAHALMNKIEIWDTEGKFIKDFSVEDLIPKPPKKLASRSLFSRIYLPEGRIFRDVAVDSKERIFVLGADYSQNPFQDVYVYDIDGKYIGKFTLPAITSYIRFNKSDELFTIENKGTLIKKYSFKK